MRQNDEFGFYLKRYKINKKEPPNERVEAKRSIEVNAFILQTPLAQLKL